MSDLNPDCPVERAAIRLYGRVDASLLTREQWAEAEAEAEDIELEIEREDEAGAVYDE